MVFSSFLFIIIFFPLSLGTYYIAGTNSLKQLVLILFSLIFYIYGDHVYVSVMIISIMIAWVFGTLIDRNRKYANALTFIGISLILGLLCWFKYMGFISNVFKIYNYVSPEVAHYINNVYLPLGISFYSFQSISYLIDINRREIAHEPSIVKFAMYKTFFPQLIAGPIVRYKDVKQYINTPQLSIDNFAYGLERFVYGLAAKVLIANNCGSIADTVFDMPEPILTAWHVWLGSIGYFFQIYFDFAGYSSMAIGMALMFGIKFKENFNFPYSAASITDFWRRWHISLSSWFRDYLYIPLGGNRHGLVRTLLNSYIVFLLCGLWHGASWNFILWGLYHGTFLVIEKLINTFNLVKLPPFLYFIRIIYVWIVIIISWVLFRSEDLTSSVDYLTIMFSPSKMIYDESIYEILNLKTVLLFLIATIFSSLKLIPNMFNDLLSVEHNKNFLTVFQSIGRLIILVMVFFISLTTLAGTVSNPFLYYRF